MRSVNTIRFTALAITVLLGTSAAFAQTAVPEEEAAPFRLEADPADPNRPFNPFFDTPGTGDIRGRLPAPPDSGPDRNLAGVNEFNFDSLRGEGRRGGFAPRQGFAFR